MKPKSARRISDAAQRLKTLEGEQRLAAAMLADGRDEALAGCEEARRWIEECSWQWLRLLTSDVERAEQLASELAAKVSEVKHEQNDEPGPAGVPVMLSAEYQQVTLFHMD